VLEREARFKDRVRGENMVPWRVAAARRLGIVDHLLAAGGHQTRNWITYMFGDPVNHRDLAQSTPHGELSLNIFHPRMQEALLDRASGFGVKVRRGANVIGIDAGPGRDPRLGVHRNSSGSGAGAHSVSHLKIATLVSC
jgi:menaquinone-9 beta-reductase